MELLQLPQCYTGRLPGNPALEELFYGSLHAASILLRTLSTHNKLMFCKQQKPTGNGTMLLCHPAEGYRLVPTAYQSTSCADAIRRRLSRQFEEQNQQPPFILAQRLYPGNLHQHLVASDHLDYPQKNKSIRPLDRQAVQPFGLYRP